MVDNNLGKIRRSMVVMTSAPGAITDFRADGAPVSAVISGLEEWDASFKPEGLRNPQKISEPRLERDLRVRGFRLPPVVDEDVPTFITIILPLVKTGLIAGAIMSFARALGEFGATIMFAGNFQGRTQTMPLAIYTAMQGDLIASITLSVILIIISFVVIAIVKLRLKGDA
mgnify:CR=1 FL=1|jgi:hypothetical protein